MITLEEAKSLKHGDILYHTTNRNADGSPQKWTVTGKPKTWKTRPNEIEIPVKYGMYLHDYVTHFNLCLVSLVEWKATGQKILYKKTIEGYLVLFDKKNYGTVYRASKRWYSTLTDRERGFITRNQVAEHILDCEY